MFATSSGLLLEDSHLVTSPEGHLAPPTPPPTAWLSGSECPGNSRQSLSLQSGTRWFSASVLSGSGFRNAWQSSRRESRDPCQALQDINGRTPPVSSLNSILRRWLYSLEHVEMLHLKNTYFRSSSNTLSPCQGKGDDHPRGSGDSSPLRGSSPTWKASGK